MRYKFNQNKVWQIRQDTKRLRKAYKARRDKEDGFTLIEALVTIVISGILSSIALPIYVNQVNRSRQNEASSTIAQKR